MVRKRIRSKCQNTVDQDAEAREQTRLHALQAFEPRQEPHRTKTNEQISFLIDNLLEVCLVFPIEGLGIPTKNNANIIDIANEIIHKKKANDGKITEFLQKPKISGKERDLLEKSTCGQANNSGWKELWRMIEVTLEDIINLFRYLQLLSHFLIQHLSYPIFAH